MAVVSLNFNSQYLGGATNVQVILPNKPQSVDAAQYYAKDEKFKVLWLLHGMGADSTSMLRKTMIEVYAAERNLAVVMPTALNSAYVNWPDFGVTGYYMNDYLAKELMPLIYHWLPISDKREDNFLAGFSMGSIGAFTYSLQHPEKFAAVAPISSCPFDYREIKTMDDVPLDKPIARTYPSIEAFRNSDNNIYRFVEQSVKNGVDLPRYYIPCGENEHTYQRFLNFRSFAEQIGFAATFESFPGYIHEWRFVDLALQKALEFFGLEINQENYPF